MPIAPPRPKSLPLNALRAFEAAARLGGFVPAAQELDVTPSAVAAHIKALEAAAGGALFERNARGVRVTSLGRRVLPDFTLAFDQLGKAVQTLRAEAAPQLVHIAALPAVAQLWLSPRLPALRASAPEITVSITALEQAPNLKRVPFDLSIFYGEEGEGTALASDEIFPVCAPVLAEKLRIPADLGGVACLTDAVWADDWAAWLAKAARGQNIVPRGPVFSLYALAVAEAVNGAGVLMGHSALIAAHLAAGTLVAPFEARVKLPRVLCAVPSGPVRRGSAVEKVIRAMRSA